MGKGLLIMLIVFGVVGVLGYFMNKIGNATEAKKQNYRKVFFIVYGLLLLAQGILSSIEHKHLSWIAGAQILLGIVFIGFFIFGKPKNQKSSPIR